MSFGASSLRSDKDVGEYVKYLLQGSGAEESVDYAALRRELESIGDQTFAQIYPNESASIHQNNTTFASTFGGGGGGGGSGTESGIRQPSFSTSVDGMESNLGRGQKKEDSSASTPKPRKFNLDNGDMSQASSSPSHQPFNLSPIARATKPPLSVLSTSIPSEADFSDIAKQLKISGFRDLDPSLTQASINPSSKPTLTPKQVKSIQQALHSVISEYHNRSNALQQLSAKLAASESENIKLKGALSSMKGSDRSDADRSLIEELQKNIAALRSKISSLELYAKSAETELQREKEQIAKRKEENAGALERCLKELHELQTQNQKRLDRNEHIYRKLAQSSHKKGGSIRNGLDRTTLEVIDIYEEKLKIASEQMEHMKLELALESPERKQANYLRNSPNRPNTTDNSFVRDNSEDLDPLEADPSDSKRLSRVKRATARQLKVLQDKLDSSMLSYRGLEKENEILKLKLLGYKNRDASANDVEEKSTMISRRFSTREMIRRDKQEYMMKVLKIDGLNLMECREVIKYVSERLDVKDIEHLAESVDQIEKVIFLIPQMQNFIQEVDKIVRRFQNRFMDTTAPTSPGVPQKLSVTLDAIRSWSNLVLNVEELRQFRSWVHNILGIEEEGDSADQCLDALRQSMSRAESLAHIPHPPEKISVSVDATVEPPDSRLMEGINHFVDLFEIRDFDKIVPKINELFVFVSEVEGGLVQLRDALGMDEESLPIAIMKLATENVIYLTELTAAVREGSNIHMQAVEEGGSTDPIPGEMDQLGVGGIPIQDLDLGPDFKSALEVNHGGGGSMASHDRHSSTHGDEGDHDRVIGGYEEMDGNVDHHHQDNDLATISFDHADEAALDMTWDGYKSGSALSEYEFNDANGLEQEPIITLSDSLPNISMSDGGMMVVVAADSTQVMDDDSSAESLVARPSPERISGVDILLGRGPFRASSFSTRQ